MLPLLLLLLILVVVVVVVVVLVVFVVVGGEPRPSRGKSGDAIGRWLCRSCCC